MKTDDECDWDEMKARLAKLRKQRAKLRLKVARRDVTIMELRSARDRLQAGLTEGDILESQWWRDVAHEVRIDAARSGADSAVHLINMRTSQSARSAEPGWSERENLRGAATKLRALMEA